jgi:large subunit ribosomal protein L13
MISVFIRGKHKPEYSQNRFDMGDKVVVVNASKVKVTGKKRYQKLYRHHTGYAGGLKEITFKDMIEKDPAEIIRRAVKGMLPNNNIQGKLLDLNLIVHAGMYHNHLA